MMGRIFITVNGEKRQVEDGDSISYSHLCDMAGEDANRTLSVVYDIPKGPSGSIFPGKRGPLADGARYVVMATNNA